MIVTVSTTDSLWAAIKGAHSGDTIQMTAGSYSLLRLDSANIAGNVTITSADPTHPAVIAGLNITSSSGLTFSNIEITPDRSATGTGFGVMLGSVQNVTLDHVNMHGTAVGDGDAIMVRNSTGVAVTNSDIHDLGTGINHLNSSQLNFSNNTVHNIESDGIRGGGSSNVTISGNHFSDFFPKAGEHPDAIQFWTANTTTVTHDLTITNNVYVRGAGLPVQGVFVGNEAQIPFQNVTISGNAIVGGLYQGIALNYGGSGINVANNLVQGYSDNTSWILLDHTTNAVETNNQATAYQSTNNIGLLETGDTQIAQVAIGDLTTLDHWLGVFDNAQALPSTALDASASMPPAALPAIAIDTSAILTAVHDAMAMSPYGGGWLL